MTRRNKLFVSASITIVAIGVLLAVIAQGASKDPSGPVNAEAIGVIDMTQIQSSYPAFVKLQDLKNTYDADLNSFAAYNRQQLSTYVAELEQQKAQESQGKTDEEKKTIEDKYNKLAQDKATQINQDTLNKQNELQSKLNDEIAKADENLRQTIAVVSNEKNLKLVLVKNAVYFGGVDVTSDVIEQANKAEADTATN